MTQQNGRRLSRILRGVALTLMGLTVTFTLLGGVGTTCVALGAEKYDSMAALVPYKPLYQALVVISLVMGVWGIPVTFALIRGGSSVYRNALLVLIVGTLSAGIQTGVSQAVRGSSAPVNIRFYISALTLVIFLLLRLPPIWEKVDYWRSTKGKETRGASAGIAAMVCGIVVLTTHLWVGATHTPVSGSSWVEELAIPLRASGWALVLAGTGLVLASAVSIPWREVFSLERAPIKSLEPTRLSKAFFSPSSGQRSAQNCSSHSR
jgi:hypothetical protein